MTEPLYHITRSGVNLCAASVGACTYDEADHFTDKREARTQRGRIEALSSELLDEAKTLNLFGDKITGDIVYSDNWGGRVSDYITQHVKATGVKPTRINLCFFWVEPSLDNDPQKEVRYFFETTSRFDEYLDANTNIYRLTSWNAADVRFQKDNDLLLISKTRDFIWNKIPAHRKWEVGFGEEFPVLSQNDNNHLRADKIDKQRRMKEFNRGWWRDVLNKANLFDYETLVRTLTSHTQTLVAQQQDALFGGTAVLDGYLQSVNEKAANIFNLVRAVENHLIGPYQAADRGLAFYRVVDERKTVVKERLHSTIVRGELLRRLGNDSYTWLKLSSPYDRARKREIMKQERERFERDFTDQERFERVRNSARNGIPYQSPMVFWTDSTPDGSRWELGLDVVSPENGSHRMRFLDINTPGVVTEQTVPVDAVDGFFQMKAAMERKYGRSARWSYKLQRDMRVLADIVEGHTVMVLGAKDSHDHLREYGIKPANTATAQKAPKGFFGKLLG